MIIYALKYKGMFDCFTFNKNDLKPYFNNRMSSVVDLKVIKNKNGKYQIFESDDVKIIVDCVGFTFDEKVKGLKGKLYKADLEEI